MDRGKRKFDLLLTDMDGTLTDVKSPWEYLHRRLGLWDGNGDRHLKAWLAGEIDYDEFFRRDVAMWLGMEGAKLTGLLDEIRILPGVAEAFRTLTGAGVRIVILSTGFTYVADRVRAECDLDLEQYANVMRFDEDGRFSGMDLVLSGDEAHPLSKAAAAARIMREKGVDPSRCAALGDSPGDLGLFRAAGYSIAVHGAPELGETARLRSQDLRELVPHLLKTTS